MPLGKIKNMKQFLVLLIIVLAYSCQTGTDTEKTVSTTEKNPVMKLTYPETRAEEVKDDYHGTEIADPYRWLEIDTAAETSKWVAAQNEVTFDYLSKIPYREAIKERYEELFNYPKLSSPFKAGDYYFFYKNDGLQNQSVIYIQKGLDGEHRRQS